VLETIQTLGEHFFIVYHNVKMGPHEIGLEGVDWIDLAQDIYIYTFSETSGMRLVHRISLLIEEPPDPQAGLFCIELVIVRKIEGCSKQNMFCVITLLETEDSEELLCAVFL
jgi:hypothetical protein